MTTEERSRSAESDTSNPPVRILVIDDDLFSRTLLRKILRGYDVLEAGEGLTGLRLAQRERPDLIICDYLMPGMNGLELAKLLRMDARTRQIPVVLLTAAADDETQEKAARAGVRALVRKSSIASEMHAEVARILEQNLSR